MPITLTITDTQDGTGGTATIAGSGGGTNTLYRSAWTGSMTSYSWTSTGSRSGDGTIAISSPGSVALGYYLWQVINVNAGVTTIGPVVYQNLTDATAEAPHYACLEAIRLRIISLSLSGITSAKVYRKWIPRIWEQVENPPCILISPTGQETYPGIMTNRDDVGYPCLVTMVDKIQNDAVANQNRDLLWRNKIAKAFREQRLPGLSLDDGSVSLWCQLEYESILDPGAFLKNYLISFLLIRALVRESRGL